MSLSISHIALAASMSCAQANGLANDSFYGGVTGNLGGTLVGSTPEIVMTCPDREKLLITPLDVTGCTLRTGRLVVIIVNGKCEVPKGSHGKLRFAGILDVGEDNPIDSLSPGRGGQKNLKWVIMDAGDMETSCLELAAHALKATAEREKEIMKRQGVIKDGSKPI